MVIDINNDFNLMDEKEINVSSLSLFFPFLVSSISS
jgi:hypothetical protein